MREGSLCLRQRRCPLAKPLSRLCHTPRGNLAVSLAINCNISAISIWLRFIWPNSRYGPGHRLSLASARSSVCQFIMVWYAMWCERLTWPGIAASSHIGAGVPDTMTYGCESLLMWRLPDYAECPVPLPECFERALFLSLSRSLSCALLTSARLAKLTTFRSCALGKLALLNWLSLLNRPKRALSLSPSLWLVLFY